MLTPVAVPIKNLGLTFKINQICQDWSQTFIIFLTLSKDHILFYVSILIFYWKESI